MENQPSIPLQTKQELFDANPLYIEFARQTLSPPGDDARIALFFQGLLSVVHGRAVPDDVALLVSQNVQQLRNAANFTDSSPAYAANKILRCFQKQFMYRSSELYPFSDINETPWREAIIAVMGSDKFDEVLEDMYTRETQSNVVQRYNALKFILAACLDDPYDLPQVIDVGCSQNLGLKKVASNGDFEQVRFTGSLEVGTTTLKTIGRRYNRTVSQPVRIGRSLGLDIYDIRNSSNVEWVYACSSYPSELLQSKRLRETKDLQRVDLPEVTFAQGDITTHLQYTTADRQKFHDRRRYDVAFASTVMYQMTEAEREATYDNIYDHLKPNGLLVVQDFFREKNGKLIFSGPGAERYQYRTYIKDKRGDYDHPEEILQWENARCTRVQLGLGQVVVRGTGFSVAQLLSSHSKPKATP